MRMTNTRSCAAGIRRMAGLTVTVAVLSWVSACSSLGPDTASAATVAVGFHDAVATGDGAAACALLAPQTATDVATNGNGSCAEGVLDQDMPEAGTVRNSQAFGRSAQVIMAADVLFLALFDGQWLITAAGCHSRREQPYDCAVRGG